jgi:TolA-binding protein
MPRLSALRRKFGITSRRMAVRAHVAWYWRVLTFAAFGALVVAVGWATYEYGMELAGFRQNEAARELARLQENLRERDATIAEMKSKVAASERQLQIERATYGDLERQVKTLSGENAALREDLAFFQSLMAAESKAAALTVNRFRVRRDAVPGEYSYRLLLVQTGQRIAEFKGKLQFVLNLEQGERKYVLMLPPENEKNVKDYELSFKFFQRIQGTFRVAPDAVVKSMQVRVFEKGATQPKLTQTVTVS